MDATNAIHGVQPSAAAEARGRLPRLQWVSDVRDRWLPTHLIADVRGAPAERVAALPPHPPTYAALLLVFAELSRCREAQRWTAAFDAGTDGSDGAAAAALCRRTVALHLSRSAKVRRRCEFARMCVRAGVRAGFTVRLRM